MRKGKIAAQVAHASNEPIISLYQLTNQYFLMRGGTEFIKKDPYARSIEKELSEKRLVVENWWNTGHTKVVLGCKNEDELRELMEQSSKFGVPFYPITDLGLTEFHGIPTLTCCSFGPYWKTEIDKFTINLKLI